MERYLFYFFALLIIASALAAVTSRKMLRSVIYLLFTLISIAAVYFMMDYNFLGAVQLTVYAGGIVVLIIFSVFLIHHIELELSMAKASRKIWAALFSALGAAGVLAVLYQQPFTEATTPATVSTAQIGDALLSTGTNGFILPFEVISVLLLATMIGGIIVAKGRPTSKTDAS